MVAGAVWGVNVGARFSQSLDAAKNFFSLLVVVVDAVVGQVLPGGGA